MAQDIDDQRKECIDIVQAITRTIKELDPPLGRVIRALCVLSGDAISQWADDEVSLELNIGLFDKNFREIARSIYKRRMEDDTDGHSEHAGTDRRDSEPAGPIVEREADYDPKRRWRQGSYQSE